LGGRRRGGLREIKIFLGAPSGRGRPAKASVRGGLGPTLTVRKKREKGGGKGGGKADVEGDHKLAIKTKKIGKKKCRDGQ